MVKFIELESRLMVTGGWGIWAGREGTENQCLMGAEFQLGMIKKLWRGMVAMVKQQRNCT